MTWSMNDDAVELDPIFSYEGTYGGRNSREEIIRALKEALVTIENTEHDEFVCTEFRIQGIWR